LKQGDYQDPGGIDYLYEKIGETKAVLTSAGPDRVLRTWDDPVRQIRMGY
jgi:hypothetical protein